MKMNLRSSSDLVSEIMQEIRPSDRKRHVLYLSDSLLRDVRKTFPEVPVSRLVEKIFRDLLDGKGKVA